MTNTKEKEKQILHKGAGASEIESNSMCISSRGEVEKLRALAITYSLIFYAIQWTEMSRSYIIEDDDIVSGSL